MKVFVDSNILIWHLRGKAEAKELLNLDRERGPGIVDWRYTEGGDRLFHAKTGNREHDGPPLPFSNPVGQSGNH